MSENKPRGFFRTLEEEEAWLNGFEAEELVPLVRAGLVSSALYMLDGKFGSVPNPGKFISGVLDYGNYTEALYALAQDEPRPPARRWPLPIASWFDRARFQLERFIDLDPGAYGQLEKTVYFTGNWRDAKNLELARNANTDNPYSNDVQVQSRAIALNLISATPDFNSVTESLWTYQAP